MLDGHRPYIYKCPWCVRANMRERRSERKLKEAKCDLGGWVISSDFSGKHEPGIDGNVWVYIGVEVESGYGFVRLQESRSAADILVSIKFFECELKQVSGSHNWQVVHHHHHHHDKSFRQHDGDDGVVEQHGVDKGWIDNNTGGYRPNANSVLLYDVCFSMQCLLQYSVCFNTTDSISAAV